MEPQEKLTTQEFIIDRLHDIQRKAEASNYADALASMKEVKAADVKNIYLIAIEKQIAKLTDTSLSPDNRTEIVKSLPAMIDRAITDVQRRATIQKPEEPQKGQKEAALEKLKSQYFQRADDYVSKQEYQRALEEIRRIYIIEPGSVVAKEYEQKIEQLAALHARGETTPVETEEKTKAVEPVEAPIERVVLEEEPLKSKMPIIAVAAVVVLAIVGWLIFSHGSSSNTPDQPEQQTSIPQESETPTMATTTTSTPESGKETAPVEEPKVEVKTQKSAPEVKPTAVPEKKQAAPVNKPTVIQQPVKTQSEPVQTVPQQAAPKENPPAQQAVQQTEQPKQAESSSAPVPFVAVESQPEILSRANPVYPDIAIKMGLQGRVTVEVTVDPQGKPIQAKVVKSTSDIFDESAIEAVMKYKFKPAMMSTGPVTAKVYVPIIFNLRR
jgi:periplasmic protein TonB